MPGKRKYIFLFLAIAGIIISFGCFYNSSFFRKKIDYNLSSPDKLLKLPHVLDEISGITLTENSEIACVQDEIGSVFIYDIALEHLVREYKNNLKGDFEGIALVHNTMYILRSDGVLVEYSDYTSENGSIKEYYLNLPTLNNEGLCFDKKNNSLLIAAKSKTEDDLEKKHIRLIYRFDLQTKQLAPKPLIKLHIKRIESKAAELKIIGSKPGKHKEDTFNFRPSEIAVDPLTNLIYVLSSKDKMLLILDQKGKIENLVALDAAYFTQPEGMTFLENGDLLISNEAQKGKATLLLFKYRK